VDKLQQLKREQAVLARQLETLNGRLLAGDRTVRSQVTAVNRQLARIGEQIGALTGEKAQEQ
jgi:hypothetical protein